MQKVGLPHQGGSAAALCNQLRLAFAAGGAHGTAEAGTRTQCVQCVGPWGQAALRLRYVPNAGGWYA